MSNYDMGGDTMSDEIMVLRDLIKDRLGNYYLVNGISGKKLILVNAVVKYASNRLFEEELVKEHAHETLTHFATNILKSKIEDLSTGRVPGKIYLLEALEGEYDIVVDGLYDRDPQVK